MRTQPKPMRLSMALALLMLSAWNVLAADPGVPIPATSAVNDQTPGSILVYNLYSSNPANVSAENTRINITNTSTTSRIAVHFFFLDGNSCSPADFYLCLTPNQTTSLLAADIDPGVTGFIIAIATGSDGVPATFNFLIGDEFVKLASGHAANLAAEAFSAIRGIDRGPSGDINPDGTIAAIRLDDSAFTRVPRVLAVDNVQSPSDNNSILLVINRIDGDLSTGAAPVGNVFGLFFDDSERASSFSFGISSRCQTRRLLSDTFPRTTPRLSTLIPSGRTGWIKFYSVDGGILGAVINANPNASVMASAFTSGHNLHKLTLHTAEILFVPIFSPSC